jgi:ATP-dependent Lhr-like helicase
MAENTPGGFAAVYPVLAALEERGSARRGYFVEGLGAAQFAVPGAVDRLRALGESVDPAAASASARPGRAPKALVLAATDPGNPYGAALPWPERLVDPAEPGGAPPGTNAGHRPGRKAGALVITVDGELAIYVERGGRTLLSFIEDPATLALAAKALAESVHSGALGALSVERADGETIHSSPLGDALTTAGFRTTPRGLRLRA